MQSRVLLSSVDGHPVVVLPGASSELVIEGRAVFRHPFPAPKTKLVLPGSHLKGSPAILALALSRIQVADFLAILHAKDWYEPLTSGLVAL